MLLTDTAEIAGTRRTRDGYLVADVRAGRTGIQIYRGAEVGHPERDLVRVYRPEEEVFDSAAMATAAHRPITNDHPSQAVTSETWADVAVGMTGAEVVRDGNFLRVPLVLMDGNAIRDVEDGKRQLSWGYTCDLDWTAGTTPDGEPFDAVQKAIRINHLAVVGRARAGSECRIGDSPDAPQPQSSPNPALGGRAMPDNTVRPILLDGITIHTNDAGAEAIARLQRQLADAASAADARTAEHGREIQARDGQISALRQEQNRLADAHRGEVDGLRATHQQALDALQAQVTALQAQVSDAALDARVEARAALISQARRVLGDEYAPAGRSDAQIRRDVVAKALPAVSVSDGASDDYIRALFDAAMASPPPAAPAQPDPMRTAIMSGAGAAVNDAANAQSPYEQYVSNLRTAWQRSAAQGA